MMHRLHNVSSDFHGFGSLAQLAGDVADLEKSTLEVSFASVSWFDANMTAPFGSVLAQVKYRTNDLSFTDLPRNLRSILERTGFLDAFGTSLPRTLSSTIIPFAQFDSSDSDKFYDYLDEHLLGKGFADITSVLLLQFQQGLGEIFINTQIHAQSDLGVFVCGQFFPVTRRLYITLADAGITIPGAVSQRLDADIPPLRALHWALTEGHTTKRGTPGGVGLKLVRTFVERNRGELQIASGRAFWRYAAGAESLASLPEAFPGTAITLGVNTDEIAGR